MSGLIVEKKDDPKYSKVFKDILENLEYIHSMKNENLVNVYKLDSIDSDGKGIEDAIIKSILDCKR